VQLRELLTTWKINVSDEPLKRVEGHLASVKRGMDYLVGSQIVSQLVQLEERFSKWAHELNAVSIASDVAVEQIQKLTFAGAQFGTTQEEITGAMTSLTLKINEAKMGFEGAQRAFSMAGFTGDQIRGWRNGNDALLALADRMHGTIDPIRRQAMAAQLGISANSKLYAFLSQGSAAMRAAGKEAEELGTVMSKDQVEGLVAAQNAMTKLSMVVQGLGKLMATYFAPSIKQGVEDLLTFYKANKKLIETNVKRWVDDLLYALGYLYGILKFVVKAILDFANAHPVLFRRITEVIAVVIAFGVALMAFGVIMGPIMTAFNAFSFIISALRTGFMMLPAVISFVSSALGVLRTVLLWFQLFAYANPIGLIVVAIAALVGASIALWQHFVQGKDWKDTWIGKLITNVKEFIMDIPAKLGKLMDWFGMTEKGRGEMSGTASQVLNNLGSAPQAAQAMPAALNNPSPGDQLNITNQDNAQGNYQVNAPITINVQGGNAKDLGNHAQAAIKDHLDKVYRDTHRALKTSEHY
jgi:hypothetical protein